MAEWKITRRAPRCATCEREFREGERHVSLLSIRGEELSRSDSCTACFQPSPDREDLFFWFTRMSATKKRGLEFDLPTLEQLFLRLEGRTEERIRQLRFVLCLILMRKRRLKLERVSRGEDGEALIVRQPRRQETWKVYVFDFSPERLASLQGELLQVFEGADAGLSESGAGESGAGASADSEPLEPSGQTTGASARA